MPLKNLLDLDFQVRCVQCAKCEGDYNGIIFQRLAYNDKLLIDTPEENFSGPWYSFSAPAEKGEEFILIKNIAPVQDLVLVTEKKGGNRMRVRFKYERVYPRVLGKVRLDFVKELVRNPNGHSIYCLFGVRNASDFPLGDFSLYLIFDFDVGGYFYH
ncbi:MAG: hypothetical protein ACTSU5_04450, partial [Promethearchaeota archaeon]